MYQVTVFCSLCSIETGHIGPQRASELKPVLEEWLTARAVDYIKESTDSSIIPTNAAPESGTESLSGTESSVSGEATNWNSLDDFPDQLTRARKESGLSKTEFGKKLKLCRHTIRRIENGEIRSKNILEYKFKFEEWLMKEQNGKCINDESGHSDRTGDTAVDCTMDEFNHDRPLVSGSQVDGEKCVIS